MFDDSFEVETDLILKMKRLTSLKYFFFLLFIFFYCADFFDDFFTYKERGCSKD